jgi:hypothetical protein
MKNYFLTALALLFLSNLGFSQEADLSELTIISLEDKTAQNPYDFEPSKGVDLPICASFFWVNKPMEMGRLLMPKSS